MIGMFYLAAVLFLTSGSLCQADGIFEILVPGEDSPSERVEVVRLVDPGPPPYKEYARMSRYIMHHSDWTSMATISSRDATLSSPFANVFSVSDGASIANSSGVPYFYISTWELSAKDLKKDSRASITMSLAQSHYCFRNDLDPEDPRCAHLILTGKVVKLEPGSDEENFAKDALWSRHPVMSEWPEDHHWFFAKLSIENILLLDFFGGAQTVDIEKYYMATPY